MNMMIINQAKILLLFAAYGIAATSQDTAGINSNYLDLTKVETVRVLLFDTHPTNSLSAEALESPVKIILDDFEFWIEPGQELIITGKQNKLEVKFDGLKTQTKSILIENRETIIQLNTESFGTRLYKGNFQIEPRFDSALRIINHVNLEDYIASVVGSEMNFTTIEALKAQAVVSRTYALWSIQNSPFIDYDLKDFEANQVYTGAIPLKPWYKDAAMATKGEILTWSDRLILSTYSSTCGGQTSNNEDVWSGNSLPYLRSVADKEMCSISPHYRWEFEIEKNELNELLKNRYGFTYNEVKLEKDYADRITTVTFLNSSNQSLEFSGNEFRLLINRNYTPLSIRSTRFQWNESDESVLIKGGGLGHGVGMCQWGAKGFAQNGWNYKEILSFYFNGTNVVNFHEIESQKIALHK